jgi:hypothetical protein
VSIALSPIIPLKTSPLCVYDREACLKGKVLEDSSLCLDIAAIPGCPWEAGSRTLHCYPDLKMLKSVLQSDTVFTGNLVHRSLLSSSLDYV